MNAEIWDATEKQLKTLQAKITYLGEQEKPIPTIVFAAEGHTVSMARFLSVQRSKKKPYINDELQYIKRFTVTVSEIRRILGAVRPIVTAAALDAQEFVSFSILLGSYETLVGHEFLINRSRGKQFLEAIQESISPTNSTAKEVLQSQMKNLYP